MYGGFDGTETNISQRNPAANKVYLDGNELHRILKITAGPTLLTDLIFTNVWAQRNDFEHVGYFKLSTYFFSAWQHTQRPTFLCHYVLPKNAIEFITVFDDNITFSTVSNASWHDSPQFPGYYVQTFSQKEPQPLWHQHIQMENYLMDVGKAELVHLDLTCQDCLNYYLGKQTSFIRSIPLWPIRALYWAFVRKNKWHNKSIKTQHELGMIRLPSEAQTSPSIQTLR